MYPILYENITAGTVPSHRGLGTLSDCLSCTVEQKRNGSYELAMKYPINGIHASELAQRRIIKAKPNYTDNPQLFRIDKIGAEMNGAFTVYAKHISYDLSGYLITSGTAGTAAMACNLLEGAATGYTIRTDKTMSASFKIYEPASVRSYFGGRTGSFLDIYGPAEIKYDNFRVDFLTHAGQDRGVTIRYKKNLLQLSQEIDSSNLYTAVLCFAKDNDGNITAGSQVPTGLTLDVPKVLIIDASGDFNEEPATTTKLTQKAEAYINSNNLTVPKNNIKLGFAQSEELTGRVDLCDTVTIYYEALGISREQTKCIRTVWDVIREKYIETEFGDVEVDLADSIIETNKQVEEKPSVSYLEASVKKATELITGNLGGYVILHDSNNDGEPDEILIMNTPDITTATKVWRWNKNGLGYSSTGYSGTFGLAMTSEGEIVADFVTTGQMSGNRVRTGLITSTNGQLILDLDNGTITAPSITLNGEDVGNRLDELEQTSIVTTYALSNSGTVIPSTFPLDTPTAPTAQQPYLWSKTVYTYANGQTNISYGVSVRGNNGQNGADGAGLAILGNYETMEDLVAAHPTGSAGQAYMIGTDLAVWNTQTNSWEDVGRIQGPSGGDGLWLAIENDDTGSNMNITYTAHLIKGTSTDVTETYNAVFVWQMVKEAGITEIANNTPTVTVSRDTADYGGTIRCICIAIVDEETMQDYAYNTIQDYSNNDIQIIGENVIRLIGEASIYKPYAIASQFQVLEDEISSKVAQTEFNSLEGTVTTQGTLIQQNANAILLKADTSTVNAGLNGKMATDMSNRSASILIDSGQIRFDANSLIVNSNQFTLDANGNATFGGNISAASINIGGEAVGIGLAIDNAEADAITAAATDATNKANAAITTAASDATTKANNAQTTAINTASADATTKANNAQSNAISTAAADATTKANNALNNSKSYTDTGLATKVGNNEVRTKFAADTHSVTIESGTVKFKSNTLLIDSTQFTLDASGNATFKGNLTAATLNIGGTATNIGTAINNAESDAIATAAADATTKANSAKTSAISTAAADATTKANNAQSTAISTAAADATTKANNALNNSKSYTDTGLATKVGNNEIRTKFAADATSVTIESGEVSFRSNTFSVDSNNLQITKYGLVTASNFRAKGSLRIVNASDVVLSTLEATASGGLIAVGKTDTTQVATLQAQSNGGFLSLADGTGTQTAYISGASGNIKTDGNITADGNLTLGGSTQTDGLIECKNLCRIRNDSGDARLTSWLYNDNGMLYIYDSGDSSVITLRGDTGVVKCVSVTQTSSRKVKENIKPMTDEEAEKILQLEAVSFDYKNKIRGTDKRGFIAEDVEKIIPNLVTPETEEAPASLDYIGMIPYLVKTIQKQQKEIDLLKSEINKIKGE